MWMYFELVPRVTELTKPRNYVISSKEIGKEVDGHHLTLGELYAFTLDNFWNL